MWIRHKPSARLWLTSLASILLGLSLTTRAQTTPNVAVEILGTETASLIGGDLTDPENDGLDETGAALDPSWNWIGIDSSVKPDFGSPEQAFNIFDNVIGGGDAKWCCDDATLDNPMWVAVQFEEPVSLTHFTVTSGNDTPDRDPTDWAIQGSNDGVTYTDIYHFTDTVVPWDARNQVVKFTLPTPSLAYTFIRYIAYETPGTLHQLNEIEYFGIVGGAAQEDTDKDGMPDLWEIQYGFDPNDAADATQDCNNNGITNLGEYTAGLDPCDATKPEVVSASTTGAFDTVRLTFSEDLDPATAEMATNYTISPDLAVTAAAYRSKVVTLTTAKQTPGATQYTVSVKGVKDLSQNEIAAGATAAFYSYSMTKAFALKFARWSEISGSAVADLVSDPRYPASPDLILGVPSFNSRGAFPDDVNDNYGATIEGFLTPAESASYRFFVTSDDASELWLSTDATEANLQLVAQETDCCEGFQEPDMVNDDGFTYPTSEPIALTAGRNYFVRLIYKEGTGGDYGQVAWRKEGDTTAAASLTPIPGEFLSAAVDVPVPSEGTFLTQTPAPNAKGVSPVPRITVSHRDGQTEWTDANTTLKLNGSAVASEFSKDANIATITYKPAAPLASQSIQTATLEYLDAGGQPATLEWSFETLTHTGMTTDVVDDRQGLLLGTAQFTPDAGGKSGAAGDYGIDFGTNNKGKQAVLIVDASILNEAAENDELSIVAWQKLHAVSESSLFWGNSPSSSGGERGFQVHAPWAGGTLYFDTAGCCDGFTQRISASIIDFPGYSGEESWWQTWHHLVVQKKGSVKEIWIDGQLFLFGESVNPLPMDFNEAYWGYAKADDAGMTGIIDDAAIFATALGESDIQRLASGTLPNAMPAAARLLAYWNFNDASVPTPTVTATLSGANLTISWDQPGFRLQSSSQVNTGYADVPGVTGTSYTAPVAGDAQFYRMAK